MITLVHQSTEFGEITIFKSRQSGSCMYCEGGSYQSEADCRGISLASYVHAIHSLLTQLGARDVVVIGCGGGTLATMLAYSGVRVSVVDVNPASVILAKKYFSLPQSVRFHLGDGRAFLEQTEAIFDAVVVDAFLGNEIPEHFRCPKFFEAVRKRLTPNGVVFLNLHVAHDLDPGADAIGAAMLSASLPVRILDTPGVLNRNAIVLGGAVADLTKPRLAMPPEITAAEIFDKLDRMRFRSCRPLSGRRLRFDGQSILRLDPPQSLW